MLSGKLTTCHTFFFQGNGFTSVPAITKDLGWERDRAIRTLVSLRSPVGFELF